MTQAGRDALAKAPTGSGKTLAYLAAIIHDLQSQEPHLSRAEGTYAIIMAPTRELCIQICDVLTLILRRFIWLVRNLTLIPDMVSVVVLSNQINGIPDQRVNSIVRSCLCSW